METPSRLFLGKITGTAYSCAAARIVWHSWRYEEAKALHITDFDAYLSARIVRTISPCREVMPAGTVLPLVVDAHLNAWVCSVGEDPIHCAAQRVDSTTFVLFGPVLFAAERRPNAHFVVPQSLTAFYGATGDEARAAAAPGRALAKEPQLSLAKVRNAAIPLSDGLIEGLRAAGLE